MAENPENTADPEATDATARQSFAGGVSNRRWFVAAVRRNYEELCRKRLQLLGYEAYVASQKETHVYPNRHRREVTHIVITGLVFIRLTESERLQVLKDCPLVQFFLTDKAGILNEFGRRPLAVIPDRQMETLQFMLYHASTPVTFTAASIHLGDRVRVIRGQLAGLEGSVTRNDNQTYLVVAIDILGCAMVSIPTDALEKLP